MVCRYGRDVPAVELQEQRMQILRQLAPEDQGAVRAQREDVVRQRTKYFDGTEHQEVSSCPRKIDATEPRHRVTCRRSGTTCAVWPSRAALMALAVSSAARFTTSSARCA